MYLELFECDLLVFMVLIWTFGGASEQLQAVTIPEVQKEN